MYLISFGILANEFHAAIMTNDCLGSIVGWVNRAHKLYLWCSLF